MFPLNWNIPFIRKNGSRTTLGAITGDIAGIEEDVAELTEKTDGLWDNMLENGAVNNLGITKDELHALNTEGTWNGETYTHNSATFACEYDDVGYLKKVTVNKSTGGNSILTLKKTPKFPYLPIKLTGCPSGGEGKYYNYYANWSTSAGVVYDYGDGATITSQFDYSTYPNARLAIRIDNGQTVSDLVFYPMLSDPSLNLSYDDYVPYTKTNRELTEELAITDHWEDAKVSGFTYFSGSYLKKYGHIVTLSFSVATELPAGTDTKVLTLPEGCRPAGNFIIPAYVNGVINGHAWIRANGDVEISPSTTGTYLGLTTTFIATQ